MNFWTKKFWDQNTSGLKWQKNQNFGGWVRGAADQRENAKPEFAGSKPGLDQKKKKKNQRFKGPLKMWSTKKIENGTKKDLKKGNKGNEILKRDVNRDQNQDG